MRILLITYEFPPSPSPQSLRWAYLCRELHRLGHDIDVLTIDLGGAAAGEQFARQRCRDEDCGSAAAGLCFQLLRAPPPARWRVRRQHRIGQVGDPAKAGRVRAQAQLQGRGRLVRTHHHGGRPCGEQLVQLRARVPVPLHLRNAPTPLMKHLGYGKDYRYVHSDPEAKEEMECLPEQLKGRKYFNPDE